MSVIDAYFEEAVYRGKRVGVLGKCHVTVNGEILNPRFDQINHSPTGFEWGYNGSGPSQLAFAILAREYNAYVAKAFYTKFREKVVSKLANDEWVLTSKYIDEVMADIAGVDFDMDSDEAQYREFNDH